MLVGYWRFSTAAVRGESGWIRPRRAPKLTAALCVSSRGSGHGADDVGISRVGDGQCANPASNILLLENNKRKVT